MSDALAAVRVLMGDVRQTLRSLPDASVHCVVTSPPYWGLRDYGVAGQIGLETTPELYVESLVGVFRAARRVLRDDGVLWLNLGDTYASTCGHADTACNDRRGAYNIGNRPEHDRRDFRARPTLAVKPKDLVGIPWRVAFALQADGWYLRSDCVWSKPNPMPESVTDRPTKAHEYVFLLSKSERYFYDSAAVAEPSATGDHPRRGISGSTLHAPGQKVHAGISRMRSDGYDGTPAGAPRNLRTVWTFATKPFPGAHFAAFPPELAARCIRAGCPPGGTVLDPFGGTGTTAAVAVTLGRTAILCELNPTYVELIRERLGLFRPAVEPAA